MNSNIKHKVFKGIKIIAIATWLEEKIWVRYIEPLSQCDPEEEDVMMETALHEEMEQFAKENNLTLWSY